MFVSGININPINSYLVSSVSYDKDFKLWDIRGNKPLYNQKIGV